MGTLIKKQVWVIFIVFSLILVFSLKGASAQEKRPYVMGSIFSYTGPGAFLGDRMKTTVEMKVEQINKMGGINGRPIKLIIYDAGSEVTKAVMAAKRLIEQDKVDVIVGCGNMSGLALAIVPIVEKGEIPFMSVSGSAQIITPVEQRNWTFKAHATDEEIIGRAIDYWKKVGMTKVAMLSDTTGFGKSARDELKKQAPSAGINVVSWEEFDMNATDLTPQLTRIRSADPQAILCWTVAPSGVIYLKNAKQLGMKQVLMHGFGYVVERYMEMAGEAAEGCVLVSFRYPVGPQLPDSDPCKKEILQYMKDHKEKYGFYPDVYGAEAYDGLMIVVDALRRANNYDKHEIRKAIENTKGFVTTLGINHFSPQKHYGLSKKDCVVFEWREKNWKLLMPAEY